MIRLKNNTRIEQTLTLPRHAQTDVKINVIEVVGAGTRARGVRPQSRTVAGSVRLLGLDKSELLPQEFATDPIILNYVARGIVRVVAG
jgi:hypothetical protein